MTSMDRHKARYIRRKAKRDAKKLEAVGDALNYDTVFTFVKLYRSAGKCFRAVSWKPSVQAYKAQRGIKVAERYLAMKAGKFRLKSNPEHTIRERGHERKINSIHIDDRVPEKCNSAYSLKPVLHRTLIYDNFASQEGKGTSQARKRLKCMLERHIRRYGNAGGVAVFDFSSFFDSVPHELIEGVMRRNYADDRITQLNMQIVKKHKTGCGMILGSENSQDFAISVLSRLDHHVKEKLRAEGYGRYMDDGWIIHPDYDELKAIFQNVREYAEQLGLKINLKKSRIIPFGKPFTMLKRRYIITDTGGIIQRPVRESVIRERRKIKRLFRREAKGTVRSGTCFNSLKAWEASLIGCKCHRIKRQIESLYDRVFIKEWLAGKGMMECTM